MKTVDLRKGRRSLNEVLKLAKDEALLIQSEAGEGFILEHADAFEREAAALGRSEKFRRMLETRSSERGDVPISKVCEKRGVWRRRRRG